MLKTLPHNLEAEVAVLGAVFIKNSLFHDLADTIKAEVFFDPKHAKIWECSRDLISHGKQINPISLKSALGEHLEALGGVAYLTKIASKAVTPINAAEYAEIMRGDYLRRCIIEIAENAIAEAQISDKAEDTLSKTENAIHDLLIQGSQNETIIGLADWVRKCLSDLDSGKQHSIPTSFKGLDSIIGGFSPSDLVVLAARPGMGKSALAANIGWRAAKEGKKVLFFSLEMSGEQLAARILADEYSVNAFSFRTQKDPGINFNNCLAHVEKFGFYIDDTPALEVSKLRSRVKREVARRGVDLVIADYIQLLHPSRKTENRVQEVTDITQHLKAIAKECHVPVIALSQLNRAVESRESKRPNLSDLRESGSIEQDADIVVFIYREDYYLEKERCVWRAGEDHGDFEKRVQKWEGRLAAVKGQTALIVAKHRHGPIGEAKVKFEPEYSRFVEVE